MSKLSDEIQRLLLEGLTYNEISQRLGCSKGTISYYSQKMGLTHTSWPSLKNYNWKAIQASHDHGLRKAEILQIFALPEKVWRRALVSGLVIPVRHKLPAEILRDHIRQNSYERYWRAKRKWIEYLGGRCVKCGSKENLRFEYKGEGRRPYLLVNHYTKPWKKIKPELDKYQLKCFECQMDRPHGHVTVYRRGCRCNLCREANAEAKREYKRKKRNATWEYHSRPDRSHRTV